MIPKMGKNHQAERYVSRLRLCMSGSTDYYVNDKTGQPFFVVREAINSSMIEKIKGNLVPRLEKEVPGQPTEEELAANPRLHKFMIVSDRECYSYENKTLTVKLHHLNYRKDDKLLQHLCEKLNETETEFPGTDLRLIYKLVSL